LNSQREVIYGKRRHALYGERLALDISNMIYDLGETILEDSLEQNDYEAFKLEVLTNLSLIVR